MTTRLFLARAILVRGEFQELPEHEQALVAVMTGEGSTAWWNAMDTTLAVEGATPYNSFGPADGYHVWNYPSAAVGVEATVATLLQENMSPFAAALRRPTETALSLTRAFSQTPWGGIGDVLPLEIVEDWNAQRRNYVVDRAHVVSGPGPWPYRADGHPMA